MQSLDTRIKAATSVLALYAVPHRSPLGRAVAEPEGETRFPFQRDRGRIIHSQAFRRLLGKTQVFVAGEGDHYRTRLTHTLEVAQIARDIARTLRLNEDLAECVALSHDLGHPPFGHMGEFALDAWMQEHGGRFEHNMQSLRVVTLLEEHSPMVFGLNLSNEVLEGMHKHSTKAERGGRGLSLEAQAVNLADEIAYTAHDCDDALRAGLFTRDDLGKVGLGEEACAMAKEHGTEVRGAIVQLLVGDLYAETERRLRTGGIASLEDVYASSADLVAFSAAMQPRLTTMRAFLTECMYSHPHVLERGKEGQTVVQELCDAYSTLPSRKVLQLQARTGGTLTDAIKDYVAGMTDAYAKARLAEITGE